MLYNICTGVYRFGNNTYPRRIRCRSNLGHIFREKGASYGPGNTVFDTVKAEVSVAYPDSRLCMTNKLKENINCTKTLSKRAT